MLPDDNKYRSWWDLRMTRVANRYSKLTYEAALDRIEYHNQSLYKDHWNVFRWTESEHLIQLFVNGDLIAELAKVGNIEDPENTYRWYKE